ncbi:MAG: efflux transporter outer membrane subunit [Tepidisphaeraceae bacterium]
MHGLKQWSKAMAAGSLLLVGCEVGPDYKPPETKAPSQFSEIASATRPTTESAEAATPLQDYQLWWTTFDDPQLNSLIQRAVIGNPSLQAAEARVREARANGGVAESGLWPQINAAGSYTHSRESSNLPGVSSLETNGTFPGQESELYEVGFDASWEIDVFGGTRRGIEAANANIEAAVEDRRDVLVTLLAEVASNYVQLRGAQRQLDVAMLNLKSQQDTLGLTRSRAEGGLSPYLDVAQQEAQVATTAAQIPTFQTEIRQNIHHLGILLGEDPGALSDELSPQRPIPVGPGSVPPGLPSDLLRRRPDVRRAERQLAAATANIGVATADLYPQFSITGAMGDEADRFHQLFDWSSRYYNIVPGVTWDIFDAGKVKSNIEVQNARQAEALSAYVQVVLQSFQDVDDALVAFNREQTRLQSLREAVAADQRALNLSTELFEKGSTDFLNELDAQRVLLAAQTDEAVSEQQVSLDLVALYKALGGGWGPVPAAKSH